VNAVDRSHPFYAFDAVLGGVTVALHHEDVTSRLATVKGFDAATCERALARALALPHLQKTVRTAVERRLRQLKRAQA
jgi:hypothetical protein